MIWIGLVGEITRCYPVGLEDCTRREQINADTGGAVPRHVTLTGPTQMPDLTELERLFEKKLWESYYAALALKPPYRPAIFRSMLSERGGKRTADTLLATNKPSDGFTELFLRGKENLKLTVEYIVLQSPWRQLFSPDQLAVARKRLRAAEVELPADDLVSNATDISSAPEPIDFVAVLDDDGRTKRVQPASQATTLAVSDLSDREAVLQAIDKFDQLGRDKFLANHGFGRAKWWYLLHNNAQYDSKAIVGAALGIQYGVDGRLNSFKGGEQSVVPKLRSLGFVVLRSEITEESSRLPEEVPSTFPEGLRRPVLVNLVERSASARIACLEIHGTKCVACGMDFESVYGSEFAGLIHVHHLHPLSGVDSLRHVDPRKDLVPICPNCHAVAHYGGEIRAIADIQAHLRLVHEHAASSH